ncbi:MFS transporter [Ktedonosporobacter rubrisoli]|nr:MFS transporter [Ktedonosporobacter rubrisoli]
MQEDIADTRAISGVMSNLANSTLMERGERNRELRLIARLERLPHLPFHSRIAFLLGTGLLLDGLDTLIISVILTPVANTFGASPASAGILIAAGFAGQALGALIFGYFSERFGRKIPLVIALLICGLFSLGAAIAPSFQALLLLRALQGIGLGACPPLSMTLFNEYIPGQRRGRNALLVQVYFSAGYMLASFLALLVFALTRSASGWRILFVIGALPLLIAPLIFFFAPESLRWLLVKRRTEQAEAIVTSLEQEAIQLKKAWVEQDGMEMPAQPAQQQTHLGELFSPRYRRRTFLTWVLWFSSFFILVGFSSWLPSLYINPGGLSEQQSLLLTFCLGFGTLSLLAVYAFTVDQFGRKRWFVIGFALAALGAIGGALLAGPLQAISWLKLALAGALMSLGAYICVSGAYLYTAELFPTRMRAWAISTGRSWSCAASIIAPIIIGILMNKHLSIAIVFAMLCALALPALLCVMLLGEETKQQILEKLSH